MKRELYYILFFVSVVLLQVFVFNNIEVAGIINPYIYVYFILVMPIKFNQIALMVVAFLLGSIIDLFSNTMGMHSFATTFAAFLRPYILKLFTTQDDIDKPAPSLKYLGMSVFVRYSMIMIFAHHFILFMMEAFNFTDMFYILIKTSISALISVLLIVLVERIFANK